MAVVYNDAHDVSAMTSDVLAAMSEGIGTYDVSGEDVYAENIQYGEEF